MAGKLIGGIVALALLPATAWGAGSASSLPRVASGARPGPDILYAPPARAPQLENTGVWRAPPILISGATAYRDGEFLYQDFLFDDAGAKEQNDPGDPRTAGNTFSRPNGTYSSPTDKAYANNAADLVELRVKPVSGATVFRVSLNTMKDPSLIAFTIALGGKKGTTHDFPFAANVKAPADRFITVHPDAKKKLVADITIAATGKPSPGGKPAVR